MKARVFFSWQSDTPAHRGRELLRSCLQDAILRLQADATLVVRPTLDHDTEGVPGAPSMVATIFQKIDECSIFVADVTPTYSRRTPGDPRDAPNPNVLVELGYAQKRLGRERLLLLLNREHGSPEQLPFDLRGDRVLLFHPDEATLLSEQLQHELKLILTAAGLPADIAPPVEIALLRMDRKIESKRHAYRLPIRVRNIGDSVVTDWAAEVTFPEVMLEPNNHYPIVRKADGMVVMRQTEAKHSGPFFPGDEREVLGIDYFMDGRLFDMGDALLGRTVSVSFYVGGRPVATAVELVRDLQVF